jgi:hypothetical protein
MKRYYSLRYLLQYFKGYFFILRLLLLSYIEGGIDEKRGLGFFFHFREGDLLGTAFGVDPVLKTHL